MEKLKLFIIDKELRLKKNKVGKYKSYANFLIHELIFIENVCGLYVERIYFISFNSK